MKKHQFATAMLAGILATFLFADGWLPLVVHAADTLNINGLKLGDNQSLDGWTVTDNTSSTLTLSGEVSSSGTNRNNNPTEPNMTLTLVSDPTYSGTITVTVNSWDIEAGSGAKSAGYAKAYVTSGDNKIGTEISSVAGASSSGPGEGDISSFEIPISSDMTEQTITIQIAAKGGQTISSLYSGGESTAKVNVTITFESDVKDTVTFMPVTGVDYKVSYYADAEATGTTDVIVSSDSETGTVLEGAIGKGFKITPVTANYHFAGASYKVAGDENCYASKITANGVEPDIGHTITPAFVYDEDGVGPFYIKDKGYYWTWETAFAAASSGETVVLAENYSLPTTYEDQSMVGAGTYVTGENGSLKYEVPAGRTLLVPYSDSVTSYSDPTSEPERLGNTSYTYVAPSKFRTLTVPVGATINCLGNIRVDSRQHSSSGQYTGRVYGPYGYINLSGDIYMESGSKMMAYGYIAGSGTVNAKSGSNVYELFQMSDWRGGSNTSDIYGNLNGHSFPISQYYIQNIESTLVINKGANLTALVTIEAGLGDWKDPYNSSAKIVASDGLFVLSEGSTMTRTYSGGRVTYTVNGNASIGSISLKLSTGIGSFTLTSSDYVLNLPSNMSIVIASGTTTLPYSAKLLPGTVLRIDKDATFQMNSGAELILYDYDDWMSGNYTYNGHYFAPTYSVGGLLSSLPNSPGKLTVNGTLNIGSGAGVYSTNHTNATYGNAALSGTGTIVIDSGAANSRTAIKEVSGSTTTLVDVAVTRLLATIAGKDDATPKYSMQSSTSGTVTYEVINYNGIDYWYSTEVYTGPTCSEKGYTLYGDVKTDDETNPIKIIDEQTPLKDHTSDDAVEENRVDATFDAAGSYDSVVYCKVCHAELSRETITIPQLVAVARNDAKSGENRYEKLADAVDDAAEGDTIYVLSSITESVSADKCLFIRPASEAVSLTNITVTTPDGLYVCTSDKAANPYIAVVKGITLATAECSYDAEVILRMKFYIPDELKDSGYTIALHKDGKAGNDASFNVNELVQRDDGRYWAYIGVASGEMNRTVTTTVLQGESAIPFYKTDGTAIEQYDYSVRQYVQDGLKQFTDEKQIAAVKALAVYGGYAQQYFNYFNDDPVFDNILGESDEARTNVTGFNATIDNVVSISNPSAGITLKTLQPFLDSATYLRLKFTSTVDISGYTFTVDRPDITKGEIVTQTLTVETAGDGLHYVDILDIPATYLDYDYPITVTDGDKKVVCTIKISVMAWAKLVIAQSTNENQVNVAKALYWYNQKTKDYFEISH